PRLFSDRSRSDPLRTSAFGLRDHPHLSGGAATSGLRAGGEMRVTDDLLGVACASTEFDRGGAAARQRTPNIVQVGYAVCSQCGAVGKGVGRSARRESLIQRLT